MAKQADQNQVETQTVERVPVEERGVALLQRIKDSPQGFLMLTQNEAMDIVSSGDATLRDDMTEQSDGTRGVFLTPKGEAVLGAAPARAKGTKHQLAITAGVRTNIAPPASGPKRGPNGGSKYPFDTMEVNASFHIPKTATQSDPLNSIQTSVSQAHQKYAVDAKDEAGNVIMHDVIETTYQKGADGKVVLDGEGKRVIASKQTVSKPKQVYTRTFVAANVDASDPDGVGARVWRTT